MKITRVATAVVEANFDWTIIRIETDSGIVGWGEAFFAPGLTATIRELGEFIRGRDPRDIEPIRRDMAQAVSAAGAGGQVHHAITGIEAALWDILGQHLKAPLWQLWGGKFREHVAIYCDCHGGDALESLDSLLQPRKMEWDKSRSQWNAQPGTATGDVLAEYTAEAYVKKALQQVEQGFTFLKFDLDIPNPYSHDRYHRRLSAAEVPYLAQLMIEVRQAIGPEIELAVDCHWKFSPDSSIQLARALEPAQLAWLEDPVPPYNLDALKYVRDHSPVPILSGENLYGSHEFRPLFERQAVAIVAPDFQKVGGLVEGRNICYMADQYFLPVAPHNIASPIGTMASVHIAASVPNFLALEWHSSDVPFWSDMILDGDLIHQGLIAVPSRPGLGVTPNEHTMRLYAKPGEPFFG